SGVERTSFGHAAMSVNDPKLALSPATPMTDKPEIKLGPVDTDRRYLTAAKPISNHKNRNYGGLGSL
ncbi:MAG: hypothetical protein WAN68_13665, partial [Pseudolabrys sp.]